MLTRPACSSFLAQRRAARDVRGGDVLRCGTDVHLELGLIATVKRETFYAKARDEGLRWVVCLLDAPREVRRQRVEERNRSAGPTTQIVPSEFFERASDAWQPPSEAERETWGILDVWLISRSMGSPRGMPSREVGCCWYRRVRHARATGEHQRHRRWGCKIDLVKEGEGGPRWILTLETAK